MRINRPICKQLLCALLIFLMVLPLCACTTPTREPFSLEKLDNGKLSFVNRVDGYALTLPANAEVDTDMLAVRTAIYMDDVSLYVYYQPCDDAFNSDTYIGYSNQSLLNEEMQVSESGTTKLDGSDADYTLWSRRKLSKVENDRNHYACYDVRVGRRLVYTLYFKYADEAAFDAVVVPIRDSFHTLQQRSVAPEIVLGSSASVPTEGLAKEGYEQLFAPDAPLTWGVYEPTAGSKDVTVKNKLPALEKKLDFAFPIELQYNDFRMEDGVIEKLLDRLQPGQIPEVTIQTNPLENGLMVLDVLDGKYDDYLRHYAEVIAQRDTPVLFRPLNEMNGDWCSYCAFYYGRDTDLYVELYHYFYKIFREAGADNCIWVWNPNHRSFPDFKWNDERMYYPGDEYVNVMGITAYNTGTYYEGETWQTFDELYRDLYDDVVAGYRQPMMITEFGCSSIGGDKVAWIKDMFAALPNYPQIKVAVWWNNADFDGKKVARPYWLDETPEVTEAIKTGLANYAQRPTPGELTPQS